MANSAVEFALSVSYKFPLIRALSSRRPVVLLYHSVPDKGDRTSIDSTVFEKHIVFLKKHCHFITEEDLRTNRKRLEKIAVLLTLDDGLRNNAEVVAPILRRYNVPALFFIPSRHATPGKYLWFIYLQSLEKYFPDDGFSFRGNRINMLPAQRQSSVKRLRQLLLNLTPHPSAMYEVIDHELPRLEDFLTEQTLANHCAGMTAEQVAELASDPLFSVGVHTVDHPLLTKCDPEEAFQQMRNNKKWIEETCNQQCTSMAYPSGKYDAKTLECNRALGLTRAYAGRPVLNMDRHYEIPRIGIYSPSIEILGFKVQWGNSMRALRIKMG